MNYLKKMIFGFTVIATTLLAPTVYAQAVGTLFQLQGEHFVVLAESVYDTPEECWASAQEFNNEAEGTGFIAVCWPLPEGDSV